MSQNTIERTALEGKDREALTQIASALGLKSLSRMKKADMIDAIVQAGSAGGGGSAPSSREGGAARKTIRSARASELDTISRLAADEESIGSGGGRDEEPLPIIRPRRAAPGAGAGAGAGAGEGSAPAEAATGAPGAAAPAAVPAAAPESNGGSAPAGRQQSGESADGGGDSWRDDEGGNSRRRRRRRGRDRERGSERGSERGDRDRGDRDRGYEQRDNESSSAEMVEVAGLLDLRDEGYGFLRASGYLAGRTDAYVPASMVRRYNLRRGDYVRGATRPPSSNEKFPALGRVDEVMGMTPDEAKNRRRFEDLTPLFPDEKLRLELRDQPGELTGRIIDLIAPIGKGQRGMIVSPPKAGKTTIIKQIVGAIERNNPECHVMVLQVDERPEEVTDMRRHVLRAEVVASTFDRPSDEHCHVAELAIERAKRLVELGKDVVIVLDGITRLSRAYNLAAPASGRIMSGGIDAGALYPPKRFFGAARNVEEGGSLTILATALVETNSKMDEHIFEEFKGTGNMELRLDRRLSERRVFPAIDVDASSTRHEELLFDRNQLQQVWKLRRVLSALEADRGERDHSSGKGLELLLDKLRTTRSNDEFLAEIAKAPTGMGA